MSSVKKALGTLCTLHCCYQAFSDEIETLRATDPKADLVLSTKIMTLCSHYMLEKDLLATPRKQLKT
jgi:hypothetical protein